MFDSLEWNKILVSDSYKCQQFFEARSIESTYVIISGCEFFILTSLFVFVFYKLTKLLNESEYLNLELNKQRKDLQLFWIAVFFGYGIRTVLQFFYGHYYLVIPKYYSRWMLYVALNPVMDIPNVLYVYWKHFVTFKSQEDQPAPQRQPKIPKLSLSDAGDSDSDESESYKPEKFVPYELDYNVVMDYHNLSTSHRLFAFEYQRVERLINQKSQKLLKRQSQIVEKRTQEDLMLLSFLGKEEDLRLAKSQKTTENSTLNLQERDNTL